MNSIHRAFVPSALIACLMASFASAQPPEPVAMQRVLKGKHVENYQSVTRLEDLPRVKKVVRMAIEKDTNMLVLIGTEGDVAVVQRAIEIIKEGLKANADQRVTKKVLLNFQLAEHVEQILSDLMNLKTHTPPGLTINVMHFPEAILLTGPKSTIERARTLIKAIDTHPDFPSPAEK